MRGAVAKHANRQLGDQWYRTYVGSWGRIAFLLQLLKFSRKDQNTHRVSGQEVLFLKTQCDSDV